MVETIRQCRLINRYPDLTGHPKADRRMTIKGVLKVLDEIDPLAHFLSSASTLAKVCPKDVPGAEKEGGPWFLTPRNALIGFETHDKRSTANRKQSHLDRKQEQEKVIINQVIAETDSQVDVLVNLVRIIQETKQEIKQEIKQSNEKFTEAISRLASDLACQGKIKGNPGTYFTADE